MPSKTSEYLPRPTLRTTSARVQGVATQKSENGAGQCVAQAFALLVAVSAAAVTALYERQDEVKYGWCDESSAHGCTLMHGNAAGEGCARAVGAAAVGGQSRSLVAHRNRPGRPTGLAAPLLTAGEKQAAQVVGVRATRGGDMGAEPCR